MSTSSMPLPPGAKLVTDPNEMKLPPGAKLVSGTTTTPSFGQQLLDVGTNTVKDIGSAFYGAAATANRIFANLADVGESAVQNTAGIEAAAPLRNLGQTFRQNQLAQQQEAQRLAGGRNAFPNQVMRGVTQGVLELPQYAVAGAVGGPVAGMAAVGAATNLDEGWQRALVAAGEGALTGGALHVMSPASQAIRAFGAAGMTYVQARLEGADPETALAHATTMGLMAGHTPGGATAREFVPGLGRATDATVAGYRAAAPDVGRGLVKAGAGYMAGEATGLLPNLPGAGIVKAIVEFPTIAVGGKQVARGLKKGYKAAKASLAESATPEAPAAPGAAPQAAPGPAGAPTDDALLQIYSVETDPAKRAALKAELIDRGVMNETAPPAGPNPYRGYTQTALRNVYEIEPDPAKRALIEDAAKARGLSLLNREGRRATAAPPETGAPEARGPSLTQDDVLLLQYLGEDNPQNANAETIAVARQLAAEKPGLLERLRTGAPEPPIVTPPTAEDRATAAAPPVTQLGTMEYNAPGVAAAVPPPAPPAPTPAELEAAATRPAEVGRMAPAEAKADFEQRRATLAQGQPPTPGQQFAEAQGYDWAKLSPDDRQALEQVAKAQANMAAQNLEVPVPPEPRTLSDLVPQAPAQPEPRTLSDLVPETELERQLAESIRQAQERKAAAAPPAAASENIYAKNARLAKAVRVADAAQALNLKWSEVFRMDPAELAAKVGEKSISADTIAMVVDKLRKRDNQEPPAAPVTQPAPTPKPPAPAAHAKR